MQFNFLFKAMRCIQKLKNICFGILAYISGIIHPYIAAPNHKSLVSFKYPIVLLLIDGKKLGVFIVSHCEVESKQDLCWFPSHCVNLEGLRS